MKNNTLNNCSLFLDGPAAETINLLKTFYTQGGGFREWAISFIKLIRGEGPGGLVA
jgi:hypothetical protein